MGPGTDGAIGRKKNTRVGDTSTIYSYTYKKNAGISCNRMLSVVVDASLVFFF